MEKVVNVNDLTVEELMRLIKYKKQVLKQKITCDDLDNLIIKKKPFKEIDSGRVRLNSIKGNEIGSLSFELNGYSYINSNGYGVGDLLGLLKRNYNIEVKIENEYKTLKDVDFTSTIYDINNMNNDEFKNEINNLYSSLHSLDLIEVCTNNFDMGILCNEIYDEHFDLTESNVIRFNGSVTIGEELRSVEPTQTGSSDILMSSVKDSTGNVYSISSNVTLSQVDDYLNLNNTLEPKNESKPIESLSMKQLSVQPNKYDSSTVKYFKGFLIFNSYYKDNDIDTSINYDKYNTTMIWINQPTLIKIAVSDKLCEVNIGNFITISFDLVNNKYILSLNEIKTERDTCIPIKSEFYEKNFKSSSIIKSLTFSKKK